MTMTVKEIEEIVKSQRERASKLIEGFDNYRAFHICGIHISATNQSSQFVKHLKELVQNEYERARELKHDAWCIWDRTLENAPLTKKDLYKLVKLEAILRDLGMEG